MRFMSSTDGARGEEFIRLGAEAHDALHTLIICWYTRHGHHPADIDDRRAAQPWYRTKTEPAFEDMLIKLRRVLIAARISGSRPAQPTDDQIRAVLAAWDAAVA